MEGAVVHWGRGGGDGNGDNNGFGEGSGNTIREGSGDCDRYGNSFYSNDSGDGGNEFGDGWG